jgi:hypothetical protein
VPIARVSLALFAAFVLAGGCGKPNFANIELRNQVQALEKENKALTTARATDHAATRPVDFGASPPLDQLVTVSGIKFSRLTVVEPAADGRPILRLYLVPNDSRGDAVKAAGDVSIKVTSSDQTILADTTIPRQQLAKSFFGTGVLYTYILDIPLSVPAAGELLYPLKAEVEFHELLTGRLIRATHTIPAPR